MIHLISSNYGDEIGQCGDAVLSPEYAITGAFTLCAAETVRHIPVDNKTVIMGSNDLVVNITGRDRE
jgi:hypothetical protein